MEIVSRQRGFYDRRKDIVFRNSLSKIVIDDEGKVTHRKRHGLQFG